MHAGTPESCHASTATSSGRRHRSCDTVHATLLTGNTLRESARQCPSPVTSIDHRPIGTGEVGPISAAISRAYFEAVRGKNAAYSDWLTPVY